MMPLAESFLWCHVYLTSMKQITPTSMCSKCNGSLCKDQHFYHLPYKDKLINQSSVINGKANIHEIMFTGIYVHDTALLQEPLHLFEY
jgi:hypothetical protein